MDENELQPQKHPSVAEHTTREKTNMVEKKKRDYFGDIFTFRNVLVFAIVLGIFILVFSST